MPYENKCEDCGKPLQNEAKYCIDCWQINNDEGAFETPDCPICGAESGSCATTCPNNLSPYSELVRDGYD